MAVTFDHPGICVQEEPDGVRTITGAATSIALFVGWAARGPIDRAVRLTAFTDYERELGGLDGRTLLGYSVRQFFENGGADAYVIRLVNGADATSASGVVADLIFTAASPGQWANGYRLRVTPRGDGQPYFRLEVLDHPFDESVVEAYEDLSTSPADSRFVGAVVNACSRSMRASVAASATPPVAAATAALAGGADGAVLDPRDPATQAAFNAAVLAQFAAGAPADRIDLFNLVCVPGASDPATVRGLQAACQRKRAFLIVDCSETADIADVLAEAAAMTGPDTHHSAFYFPWVYAADPQQQNAVRAFPPGGFVAGVCARTDRMRGVWAPPAGRDASLAGAVGLAATMSDAENGQLNPRGINCLRTLPVHGNVIWGARTLHGGDDRASEWKYIPVRRMALFLEESLRRGTQWTVFEPNGEPLWAQIRLHIGTFMQNLFLHGAFQGSTQREAYFVRCDGETTTQSDIDTGIVNIQVGFAPLKPAEFVVIHVQQTADRQADRNGS